VCSSLKQQLSQHQDKKEKVAADAEGGHKGSQQLLCC